MEDIPAFIMVMTLFVGVGFFGFLFTPLGRALADRLRRGDDRGAALAGDVLTELQALRHDVAELQERMDFTERLLARHSEPARLPRE